MSIIHNLNMDIIYNLIYIIYIKLIVWTNYINLINSIKIEHNINLKQGKIKK